MVAFLADENFNNDIIRGVLLANPGADILRVQDTEFSGSKDPEILKLALDEKRVLLSHDKKTLPPLVKIWWEEGLSVPAIFLVLDDLPTKTVVDDLLLVAECTEIEEWEGQVYYLPL